MSFTYLIHEHLKVNDVDMETFDPKSETVGYMQARMTALGALMLQGSAEQVRIRANINGKDYRYENDDAGKEYKELLSAMQNSENMDVVLDYEFDGGSEVMFWEELEPFNMMKYLEKKSRDAKKDIFYSVWIKSFEDDEMGNGSLYAYGEKDGKYYNGEVEYVRTNVYPVGQWYSMDDMGIEIRQLSQENTQRLKRLCLNLEKHTYNEEPAEQMIKTVNDDFEYYFQNAIMKNRDEVAEVVALIQDVLKMTKSVKTDYFYYVGEYVDDSDISDERLMKIEFDSNLNPVISVAQV